MPAVQQRPPIHIGSLEAEGPAPEPVTPPSSTQQPPETTPHVAGKADPAAAPLSHWAESDFELGATTGAGATGAGSHQAAPVASVSPLSHWGESAAALDETDPSAGAQAAPAGAGNPLAGKRLYVDPTSQARRQATAWRTSRPDDAAQMERIASSPQSTWLGGGSQNVEGEIHNKVTAAKAQGTVPVFVAYNIPNRDVGQHSAGGVSSSADYKAWVDTVAAGLKGEQAVVILEPDALAQADKLPPAQREERYAMMRNAVETLKKAGATVYLDGGNPEWKQAPDMAQRLKSAGIDGADGFALNTSNFFTTEANIAYGTAISAQVGGKHFVIDTSRNGVGPTADRQWCNPAGRALGQQPTTETGNPLVDALMWIKHPGDSDGTDNGGLPAGGWMPEYALDLAKRQPTGASASPASTPGAPGQSPTTAAAAPRHSLLQLHLAPLPAPK